MAGRGDESVSLYYRSAPSEPSDRVVHAAKNILHHDGLIPENDGRYEHLYEFQFEAPTRRYEETLQKITEPRPGLEYSFKRRQVKFGHRSNIRRVIARFYPDETHVSNQASYRRQGCTLDDLFETTQDEQLITTAKRATTAAALITVQEDLPERVHTEATPSPSRTEPEHYGHYSTNPGETPVRARE